MTYTPEPSGYKKQRHSSEAGLTELLKVSYSDWHEGEKETELTAGD
jgi:hypothetical protein